MKYEYKVETSYKTLSEERLNEWGKLGWELVGITTAILPEDKASGWFDSSRTRFFFYFKKLINA